LPRVKLDENVPDLVGTILQQAGHQVAVARDQDLAGKPDDRVLEVASNEGRVLVSLDRGFANVLQHPPEAAAGIVVIRLDEQTLPRIQRVAETLGALLAAHPVEGRLWVLDESRLRIWPRGSRSPGVS